LRIVELLRAGPRPVGAIAKRLRLRQPQVSKHLQTLKEAGLVSSYADGQKRVYGLRIGPFQKLSQWLDEPPSLGGVRTQDVAALLLEANRRAPPRSR
jgi:DNA-binding transcriptional ArsR family regulator